MEAVFVVIVLSVIAGIAFGLLAGLGWKGLGGMGIIAQPTNEQLNGAMMFFAAATPFVAFIAAVAVVGGMVWLDRSK